MTTAEANPPSGSTEQTTAWSPLYIASCKISTFIWNKACAVGETIRRNIAGTSQLKEVPGEQRGPPAPRPKKIKDSGWIVLKK